MTFYQIGLFLSICLLHGLVTLRQQQIAFSADQLIIQKQKLDFSITKPCKYQFEATRAAIVLYLVFLPT